MTYSIINSRTNKVLLATEDRASAQLMLDIYDDDAYVQVHTPTGSYDVFGATSFRSLIIW